MHDPLRFDEIPESKHASRWPYDHAKSGSRGGQSRARKHQPDLLYVYRRAAVDVNMPLRVVGSIKSVQSSPGPNWSLAKYILKKCLLCPVAYLEHSWQLYRIVSL